MLQHIWKRWEMIPETAPFFLKICWLLRLRGIVSVLSSPGPSVMINRQLRIGLPL